MQERVENEQGAGAVEPQPPTPPEPTPDPTPPAEPITEAMIDTALDEASVPARGTWECLNSSLDCKLAAPDARTPGQYFEGPTQRQVREAGPVAHVTCPNCGGTKVIYRGDKTPAAVAA